MKRSAISEEEEVPRHYLATDVPQDVRNFIGVLMPELRKEGVSYARQKKIFSSLGYELSNRTLKRYRHKVGAGHTPLSTVKSCGPSTGSHSPAAPDFHFGKKTKKTKSWTGEAAKSF
jgi:hypothetical protein